MQKHVDFVELLIYTWNLELKQLLLKELPLLKKLSVWYTVHLPLDTTQNCINAYSFFKDNGFPVKSFTFHPLPGWEKFVYDKPDVILENLIDTREPFERMCIDIGHLMLSKKEEFLFGSEKLKVIKEIHIHGIVRQKDHCILNTRTMDYVRSLSARYPVFHKAVTNRKTLWDFEIFDLKRLLISLRRLRQAKI